MNQSNPKSTKTGRIGPHTVDLGTRRITRDGQVTSISPKSAKVLELLMNARGEVVTRQELLDEVWPNVHVGEENITQSIAELRRAFGDTSKNSNYIETIPKTGYRLLERHDAEAKDTSRNPPEPSQDSNLSFNEVPNGPSIVVVPFDSLQPDLETQIIATGIARDCAITLARARWLFVTGRGSSTVIKDIEVDPIAVARQLGVRFALSGTVLLSADKIRMSVQLCDSHTGRMVWAETLERLRSKTIDLVSELSTELAVAAKANLEEHLRITSRLRPIEQLDAWGLYHRVEGPSRYASTPTEVERAHSVLTQAQERAPDGARILGALAALEFRKQLIFAKPGDYDGLKRCIDLAEEAISLDADEPDAHVPMGCALGAMGNRRTGMMHLERAVKLNPSSYLARSFMAWSYLFHGRTADALAQIDAAEIISPIDPTSFHMQAIRAHALALAGDHTEAYTAAEAADLNPRSSFIASAVAVWCAKLAQKPDKLAFHLERLNRARPDFSINDYFSLFPFEGEDREYIARQLRSAGINR